MNLRKARINDVERIQSLVNHFAGEDMMLARPLSEIYENLRDYYVAEDGSDLVGCVALHINWSDLAEVKSLAVDPEWHGRGVGGALVGACLQEARELGIETVYALTRVPDFFVHLGFVPGDMDKLPRKVWGECYRCPKFPKCDEVAVLYSVKDAARAAREAPHLCRKGYE